MTRTNTDNNAKTRPSRRQFVHTSASAVAGTALATALPAPSVSGGYFPFGSDTIKFGLIGAGGRGTGAAIQVLNTRSSHVELAAIGDVYANRVNGSLESMTRELGEGVQLPSADQRFTGLDAFRRVMESDCQVVLLCTPPGFRPLQFEEAVRAGKHVFMEKPVAVDVPGVRRVLKASEEAKQKGLAVAVGLQRRHEEAYRDIIGRLQDGAIGEIISARVYWNQGSLWVANRDPNESELSYQIRNWLYFNWLSGDHIVEQHIHNMDVINWLMNDYPVSAYGMGGRQVRVGPHHGQIFDHHAVEYTYANGVKMFSQCRQIPENADNVSEWVHGTRGFCDIAGGRIFDATGNLVYQTNGARGGHQQEQHDLFADLTRGVIPNEGEYGAKSTMTAIIGRLATYSGKTIDWNRALESQISLADIDAMNSLDMEAPVQPLANGEYPVPVPGSGWREVLDWNPDRRRRRNSDEQDDD